MADTKISALTAKATPAAADIVPILDSEDSNSNKRTTLGAIAGGTFSGALVRKLADQTSADYSTETAFPCDQETYDEGGWHDTVTNNERLTVPAGVSKVQVSGGTEVTNGTNGERFTLRIWKNGSVSYDGVAFVRGFYDNSGFAALVVSSPVMDVSPGDYFELRLRSLGDASITVLADRTWFAIRKIA